MIALTRMSTVCIVSSTVSLLRSIMHLHSSRLAEDALFWILVSREVINGPAGKFGNNRKLTMKLSTRNLTYLIGTAIPSHLASQS